MNDWIEWSGKEVMSLHGDTVVEVKLRNRDLVQGLVRDFNWAWLDKNDSDVKVDIVRYRVLSEPVSRFDLEQEFLECWAITNDLKLVKDNPELLPAVIQLYDARFNKAWGTFEKLIEQGKL